MRVALEAGASRVELCQALGLGGLTPSAGSIALAVEAAAAASAPDFVHVLVRPRGGGFVYDADELATIDRDIRLARSLGAHGVVVGALTEAGALDLESISRVRRGRRRDAGHRAPRGRRGGTTRSRAVASLAGSGVRRVLTSGGAADCRAGRDVLGRMVAEVHGALEVMAGGGVRIDDIATLAAVGVDAVHLSARGRATRGGPSGPGGGETGFDVTDARSCAPRSTPPPRHDDHRGNRATRGAGSARGVRRSPPARRSAARGHEHHGRNRGAPRRLAARHRRPRAPVRRCGIPLRALPAASRRSGGWRRGRRRARRVSRARRGSSDGANRRADRGRAALDPGAARAPRRTRLRDARRLVAVGGGRGARRRGRPLAGAAASARRLAARARAPALRARTRAGIARPPAAALRGVLVEPPRRRGGARPARRTSPCSASRECSVSARSACRWGRSRPARRRRSPGRAWRSSAHRSWP